MKKVISKRLTRAQRAELKSLAALRDEAIDTSDTPELLDWSGAKRGLFYRPVKQQLTLRLDADVVAWFKSHTTSDEGYQTRIQLSAARVCAGASKTEPALPGLRNAPSQAITPQPLETFAKPPRKHAERERRLSRREHV